MTKKTTAPIEEKDVQKKCGIVMPISGCTSYEASHWSNVLSILRETLATTDFGADLVSEDRKATIILNSIVNNLYDNQMIICDVSSRNPNVMFELGLRLAFDKPTIIIKDDITPYPFDVSAIKYIEYPRDLCYNKILLFKEELKSKLIATYEASQGADKNYKSFLSHFGTFTLAKIEKTEVTSNELIIKKLDSLEQQMNEMRRVEIMKPKDPVTRDKAFASNFVRGLVEAIVREADTEMLDLIVLDRGSAPEFLKNKLVDRNIQIGPVTMLDIYSDEGMRHVQDLAFKELDKRKNILKGTPTT